MLVIGLDCAPPALVFDRFRDAMPCVTRLARAGMWGALRSSLPPITVPAWTAMVSGKDAGELGLYGFRNREPGGPRLSTASARDVGVKRVWDLLGDAGKRVAALYVPLTHPPSPVRGVMVSCFLGPDAPHGWAFPPALEAELVERFGAHRPDVGRFRPDAHEVLLRELRELATQHFAIARHVITTRQPDFLMMVEMGPDRLHHALWPQMDPGDPRHDPRLEDEARRYYGLLDAEIGRLVEAAGENTTTLVVSDHGARTMEGGVRVNEWLRREGYLVLRAEPRRAEPLVHEHVDWSRTRAWGEGGYYARVCLNVRGREREGIVDPERVQDTLEAIARGLEALPDGAGRAMGTRVVRPDRAYARTRGVPPDLMVFFGDLRFRAIGTVGGGGLYTETDERGPDGCNHDWDGVFVMGGAGVPPRGEVRGLAIHDVGRTVLGLMGVPSPAGFRGRDLSGDDQDARRVGAS